VTVSIRKFGIIVLVSNRIEYWSNYSIRFEISNIHASLIFTTTALIMWNKTEWYCNEPVGVGTEGEPVNAGFVTLQLKRTTHVLEATGLVETDLPDFDVRRET